VHGALQLLPVDGKVFTARRVPAEGLAPDCVVYLPGVRVDLVDEVVAVVDQVLL
jgi:hypothetical protein